MWIRLNIDLGERPGEPEDLFRLADDVNIACGGHAGDRETMLRALDLCGRSGTHPGAHPSYLDPEHFGRRDIALLPSALRDQVAGQMELLSQCANQLGFDVMNVKAHGALYHALTRAPYLAEAFLDIVDDVLGKGMRIIGQEGGALEAAVIARGGEFAREQFADRAMGPDGSLVPRDQPGAVLTDPAAAVAQVRKLIAAGHCDTVCVHGDGPAAVAIARAVHLELESTV